MESHLQFEEKLKIVNDFLIEVHYFDSVFNVNVRRLDIVRIDEVRYQVRPNQWRECEPGIAHWQIVSEGIAEELIHDDFQHNIHKMVVQSDDERSTEQSHISLSMQKAERTDEIESN